MGIKKLNKFLYERNLVNIYDNLGSFIKNKKTYYNTNGNIVIAIDLLLYLYKYSHAYDSFIIGFWNQISYLLSHRIIPFYVIDNKYLPEKISVIKSRNKKKENLEFRLDNIKNQLNIMQSGLNIDLNIMKTLEIERDKLEKRIIKINKNDIDLIKEFFNDLGIPYIEAYSEADILCSKLYKNGYIVSCLSDDMDLLCFGCGSVIKFSNNKIIEFNLDVILKGLELSKDQFIEMCLLFGCDYLKPNFKMDINNIYINIKKYGSIDNILTKNIYPNFSDERSKYFADRYNNIKKIYIDCNDDSKIKMPSINNEIDINKVIYYINEYRESTLNYNDKTNLGKCVDYINNHINNKLLYNNLSFRYVKNITRIS